MVINDELYHFYIFLSGFHSRAALHKGFQRQLSLLITGGPTTCDWKPVLQVEHADHVGTCINCSNKDVDMSEELSDNMCILGWKSWNYVSDCLRTVCQDSDLTPAMIVMPDKPAIFRWTDVKKISSCTWQSEPITEISCNFRPTSQVLPIVCRDVQMVRRSSLSSPRYKERQQEIQPRYAQVAFKCRLKWRKRLKIALSTAGLMEPRNVRGLVNGSSIE